LEKIHAYLIIKLYPDIINVLKVLMLETGNNVSTHNYTRERGGGGGGEGEGGGVACTLYCT